MITLTASFIFLGAAGTAAVAAGGFGLGFATLPVVFAQMGPAGNFIGATWFFMLFLAAITSSISMYQPSLAFFQESLGISRRLAATLLVSICAIGSFLVMYYSKDGEFRDTIDNWVGTFLIYVLAAVQIICFGWIFGMDRGWKELHSGANMKVPIAFKFIMKWVAPAYLLIVFFFFCKNNLGGWIAAVRASPTQLGALTLVAAVLILLVICLRIGEVRWRRQGLDIDDQRPLVD
jgi:SNF family Na+-dependent transporter